MPHKQGDQASVDAGPPSRPRPRGRYPKGIQRRQQILDRTIEVVAELGFEGTSLRAIGDAIGVTHAALRRYFPTREELFLEVLREKDRQALAEALEGGHDSPTFAQHLDVYAQRTPGLMALRHSMVAWALEQGNEHSRAFFVERYRSLRHEAMQILHVAQARGTVRADLSPEVAASLVIAAMDGLSTQWLLDPSISMHEGMALLDHLFEPTRGADASVENA